MKGTGYRNLIILSCLLLFAGTACKTASEYRLEADKAAYAIIKDEQTCLFGQPEEMNIERPADILRRRLMIEQHLPFSGRASLGTDTLEPIKGWPEKAFPAKGLPSKRVVSLESGKPLQLSLVQALQVGALNSSAYQSRKEDIFLAALDLDLVRNDFRFLWEGSAESSYSDDRSVGKSVKDTESRGSFGFARTFKNGTQVAASLTAALVNLLTQGRTSTFGITADASISIPLLRGADRFVVTEPMTQAQRNVVYAIYEFERFKKTFAVDIASNYLEVLKQMKQVTNALENYNHLQEFARRSRMLADAGRLTEIEVDQAVQNELSARNRWITEKERYKSLLDLFKKQIGLPPDANVDLKIAELERLSALASEIVAEAKVNSALKKNMEPPGAEKESAARLEMNENAAVELGVENRLDLRILMGRVYDAQRTVVVQADALGAELTLFGEAHSGQSRSLASVDSLIRTDRNVYTGSVILDLPFERTAERNAYRESYIGLERAVRNLQDLEDDVKFSIREKLYDMTRTRESLIIQTSAVSLAEKRVKSANLFLEAGRAQIRDLLDAQEALLNAKNALIGAMVDYRIAELEFQRDTGLLTIEKGGILKEYAEKEKG